MEFEYDPNKSQQNKEKHGINFNQAREIWQGDHVIVSAKTKDEARQMIIGKIKAKLYSCVFTKRGRKIRLISCRRSRKNEEGLYYEKNQ